MTAWVRPAKIVPATRVTLKGSMNETVVAAEEIAMYVVVAALVAVTRHVPALVALTVLPETEHPAVPAVTVNVTAPVPVPPLVLILSAVPTKPLSEVILKAA